MVMSHLQDILRNLVVPCEENPLPVSELEIDEFQFHYTGARLQQFAWCQHRSAASCSFNAVLCSCRAPLPPAQHSAISSRLTHFCSDKWLTHVWSICHQPASGRTYRMTRSPSTTALRPTTSSSCPSATRSRRCSRCNITIAGREAVQACIIEDSALKHCRLQRNLRQQPLILVQSGSFTCVQSTKLCVFEERVLEIVAATKNLPGNLATTGDLPPPCIGALAFQGPLSDGRAALRLRQEHREVLLP
jgi:hypothetical protein